MRERWVMVGGLGLAVIVVVVGALVLRPWQRRGPPSVRDDSAEEQVRHVLATPSLPAALAYVRPALADGREGLGQTLLAIWATKHLRWSDVDADETWFPQFRKDPDTERGRRFCVEGTVVEIAAATLAGRKTFRGILISPPPVVPVQFTAVGSSGAIVAHSAARFCGVATGLLAYQSNDGPKEGLQALGMFDLPENR